MSTHQSSGTVSALLSSGSIISMGGEGHGTGAGQDVALRGGSEVAVVDFGEDAGVGMENVQAGEYTIPFLVVLQTNSPEVDESESAYIVGAKAGMLLNRGTRALYDVNKEAYFWVPVKRDHNFAEYTPRDMGGGFHGLHDPTTKEIADLRAKHGRFGKLPTDRGTELVEAFYQYGFIMQKDVGIIGRCVISFASTQIKKHQQMVGFLDDVTYMGPGDKRVKPPIWAHRWRVETVGEQNKKGKFFGWKLTLDGTKSLEALIKRTDDVYIAAKAFNESLTKGEARAAMPNEPGGADATGTGDDEIPF